MELVRVSNRDSDCVSELLKIVESKLGVVIGESLADDMEGCGEELVLRRACAPGGGWPKERVEIIRSSDEGQVLKARGGRHWTSSSFKAQIGASGEMVLVCTNTCTSSHSGVGLYYKCNALVHKTDQCLRWFATLWSKAW